MKTYEQAIRQHTPEVTLMDLIKKNLKLWLANIVLKMHHNSTLLVTSLNDLTKYLTRSNMRNEGLNLPLQSLVIMLGDFPLESFLSQFSTPSNEMLSPTVKACLPRSVNHH